jgi:hypothetical protein
MSSHCSRFSGCVLGVAMLVKGREGRHTLVCLGRGGACCGRPVELFTMFRLGLAWRVTLPVRFAAYTDIKADYATKQPSMYWRISADLCHHRGLLVFYGAAITEII